MTENRKPFLKTDNRTFDFSVFKKSVLNFCLRPSVICLLVILNILISSPIFAAPKELGPIEGLPGGYNPEIGDDPTDVTSATEKLTKILSNTFGVMTLVGGIMFSIYFISGGLNWITSSGEKDKVEKAKKMMENAAIGLIVIVASYGIAFIIGQVLGLDILNPAKLIIENLSPTPPKE